MNKTELIDGIFAVMGLMLSHIEPYFSMVLGAFLYYVYMKNRYNKPIEYDDLLIVIFTASTVSYFTLPILKEYLSLDLVPSISFAIGIFGRDIINYILFHKMVGKILDKLMGVKK